MLLNKILTFAFLVFVISCNGQEKTNSPKDLTTSSISPLIVRKSKPAALAPDFDTSLVSQYIRSIFQDSKGNLWFGTIEDGVVKYDKRTLTYFSNLDGFISNSVFAINEDKNGNMWFGTNQGVYKYDGKSFRIYTEKDGLSKLEISRKSILVDKMGTIWVGTHAGVFIYNPIAENQGRQSFSLFKELPPVNIAGILEDKKGNIWFATSENGVYCYDGKTIIHFAQKRGLGENYAGGMAEDKDGNMWFTFKNGICKYDGKNWTEFTSKDGLGGTEIWGILIEQSGIVWVTARGSTTRFNPNIPLQNPNAFKVFTSEDGFTCCVQSMFQDQSGNTWFGSGQGLYRFDGKRFYQVKQNGTW